MRRESIQTPQEPFPEIPEPFTRAAHVFPDMTSPHNPLRFLSASRPFLDGLAHDINNALGPLVLLPPSVLERLPAGDPLREDLQEIVNAVDRLTETAQHLSLLSHDASRLEPVELQGLMLSALRDERVQSLVALKQTHLEGPFSTQPLWVRASPAHLHVALLSLARASLDFLPEQGRLLVTLDTLPLSTAGDHRPEGILSWVTSDRELTVEESQRFFDPYFARNHLNVRRVPGLSLVLAYRLLKNYGATVQVKSGVGMGWNLEVRFPLVKPLLPENEPRGFQRPFIALTGNPKDRLNTLRHTLQLSGYEGSVYPWPETPKDFSGSQADVILLLGWREADGEDSILQWKMSCQKAQWIVVGSPLPISLAGSARLLHHSLEDPPAGELLALLRRVLAFSR